MLRRSSFLIEGGTSLTWIVAMMQLLLLGVVAVVGIVDSSCR